MATLAIIFGGINLLFGLLELCTTGYAATGFFFGTWGLLFAAASLPVEFSDLKELSPRVKLGIALTLGGMLVSIITGFFIR